MKISKQLQNQLLDLMTVSAEKGNLANAGAVLDGTKVIATAESWVASSCDATAHSERMLVGTVCNLRHSNYTPGLTMVSVVEPCIMCMSACSQAGYSTLSYIIPAHRYVDRISYITDTTKIDKHNLAKKFTVPIKLVQLHDYEAIFCKQFEESMGISR